MILCETFREREKLKDVILLDSNKGDNVEAAQLKYNELIESMMVLCDGIFLHSEILNVSLSEEFKEALLILGNSNNSVENTGVENTSVENMNEFEIDYNKLVSSYNNFSGHVEKFRDYLMDIKMDDRQKVYRCTEKRKDITKETVTDLRKVLKDDGSRAVSNSLMDTLIYIERLSHFGVMQDSCQFRFIIFDTEHSAEELYEDEDYLGMENALVSLLQKKYFSRISDNYPEFKKEKKFDTLSFRNFLANSMREVRKFKVRWGNIENSEETFNVEEK